MLKILLFVFLLSLSDVVLSDTYPAVSGFYGDYGAVTDCQELSQLIGWNWDHTISTYVSGYRINSGNGYFCRLTRTDGSTADSSMFYPILTCPGGGTLSGSSCINASACSLSQIRNEQGVCVAAPAVVCPPGQYALQNVCTLIPNCNSTSPADGQYFDTTTGTCLISSNVTLCIGGDDIIPTYFCPPVDDCKKADFICSDKSTPQTVDERAAAVSASKVKADDSLASAQSSKDIAAAAAAAKLQKSFFDAAAAASAKMAADQTAASAQATLAQKAAAAKAYADQATAAQNSAAKSRNSSAASEVSASEAQAAVGHASAIPSSNPGNAETRVFLTDQAAIRAGVARDDAVSGEGSGTGTQQGTSAGTCTETGTCTDGLAKDSTVRGIKEKLDKTGSPISIIEEGEFEDSTNSLVNSKKAELANELSNIKTEIRGILNLTLSGGDQQLPVYDYGTIKGVHVVADLNRFSSSFITIGSVVFFLAALVALSIVLG